MSTSRQRWHRAAGGLSIAANGGRSCPEQDSQGSSMQHQPVSLDGFDSFSHDLEALALRAIEAQLRERHPVVVLFSAGKDSSVLANLTLNAAANVAERGE